MPDRRVQKQIERVCRRELTDGEGNSREYYVGLISTDVVKPLTFVPVLEHGKKTYLNEILGDRATGNEGYQRPGTYYYMNLFAAYLKKEPLSVVPPIVLNGRGAWEYVPSEDDPDIGTLNCFGPAAIVDGQHRCGGYVAHYEDTNQIRFVEFILANDLTLEEEKQLFLDLNTNARSVVKGLTDLLIAGITNDPNGDIARALSELPRSPFSGNITIAQRVPNHLFSMNAVIKAARRTFVHGAFEETGLDDKIEIIIEYWVRIADTFHSAWADKDVKANGRVYKLLEATGLHAFSLAASDILGPAFDPATQTMNWDQVQAMLDRLGDGDGPLDLRKNGHFHGLTGEVGAAKIHTRIQELLALGAHSAEREIADE